MTTRTRISLHLALLSGLVAADAGASPAGNDRFTVTEAMIPMRDGVKLHTRIFRPKDQQGPCRSSSCGRPTASASAERAFATTSRSWPTRATSSSSRTSAAIGSEGTFVMQRPPRARGDAKAIDEGTDTYDTIDWLLKNVPGNNGRVGMLGISYAGWTDVMALLDPHPALKAVSPQASPADMFLGDDFHHNGAFRLSYGFEYVAMMETDKDNATFAFDRHDTYEWYLRLGPLSNVDAKYFHGRSRPGTTSSPTPTTTPSGSGRRIDPPHPRASRCRRCNVAGWCDQEDFYGPIADLRGAREARRERTRISSSSAPGTTAAGPAAPATGSGRSPSTATTGEVLPRRGAGALVRLLPQGQGQARPARGPDVRDRLEPLATLGRLAAREGRRTDRRLYFGAGGAPCASTAPPAADGAFDAYVSDPAQPVPYRPRPIQPTYRAARSGRRGWSRTSGSSTTAPTC